MKGCVVEYTAKSGLKIICFFLVITAIVYAILWPAGVSINAARVENDDMHVDLRASSIRSKKFKTSFIIHGIDIDDAKERVVRDVKNITSEINTIIGNKTVHSLTPKDDMEAALESASMENKTVIIAVLNKAYVGPNGILNLFLQSLHEGHKTEHLIKHLLLVAVDEIAFLHCKALNLNCYQLVTEGVSFSEEVFYMSDAFIKMMWRRTQFLRDVLRRGYSFIFTDLDILWLQNPFSMLEDDRDLQISCDNYNASADSNFILINTGFYFVKANERSIALFDRWYAARNHSAHMKDQDVLLKMKFDGVFEEMGMNVKYLDTEHFSGFCQKSKDFTKVITMHANCCITTALKIVDLRDFFQAWKKYKSTTNATWPQHTGCVLLNKVKETT